MSSPTTPLGVLALGAGVTLLFSAATGQSPLGELREVLSKGALGQGRGAQPLRTDVPATSREAIEGHAGTAQVQVTGTPQLVPIGQGTHKLQAPAAAAFRRAESVYGRPIPITGSNRSAAQQRANHRRDPSRFGPAEGNAHVLGLAIDINLPALGIRRGTDDEAGYSDLVSALEQTGWCNWQRRRGDTGGMIAEPWHWSYGVCR